MTSSGTVEERFLSISDDDIQKECKKYPEEKYSFVGAIPRLIETKEMIRKPYLVLDRLSMANDGLLGRLANSAADHFLTIFNEVQSYSVGSEPGAGNTSNHDRIVARLRHFFESITSREPWNKENGNLQPNPILDAYMLAFDLDQESKELPDLVTQTKEIEGLKMQTKNLIESLSTKAGKEALRTFGQHYHNEGNAQEPRNWLWLGFAAVILLLVGVVLFSLHPASPLFECEASPSNWSDPHAISYIVEKVLVLSILAFLARFGFHQYSIRMHLFSAYRQKEVLANTFELFLGAETMASRRDLIMTEVIGPLASLVPDGYIRKDAPELHPLAEIAKVIASFKGKEK
jgi:hypothetical protein